MILEGSGIVRETVPSIPGNAFDLRKKCESDGIIVDGIFTQDFRFNSWSLAACVVLGSSKSGPKEWKSVK